MVVEREWNAHYNLHSISDHRSLQKKKIQEIYLHRPVVQQYMLLKMSFSVDFFFSFFFCLINPLDLSGDPQEGSDAQTEKHWNE